MTGLETILDSIRKEAQVEADRILAEAKQQTEKIALEAREQEQRIITEAQKKAAMQAGEAEKRARSAAQLAAKQSILKAKQEWIGEIIERAKGELMGLGNAEYFELMRKMVRRYAQEGEGEIIFSEQDKKRIPDSFYKAIQTIYPDLHIAERTASISGGFLLAYGGIEVNCSFDAVFEASEEEMRDRVHTFLFE